MGCHTGERNAPILYFIQHNAWLKRTPFDSTNELLAKSPLFIGIVHSIIYPQDVPWF